MPTLAEMPEFTALDESTRGHVTALGFDKLEPLQAAITAAGKLAAFGSNPDELIRVPKDAAGDALTPLYERLGVPKDATGYTFDPATPADVADRVRAEAAALKLTPAQASTLLSTRQAEAKASADGAAERQLAAVTAAKGELQAAWGGEHGVREFRASKALETFGWTIADVSAMAGANKDAYVKIMQNMSVLGEKMAEAKLLGGSNGTGETTSFTPDQAVAKAAALQADPAFRSRWMSPDKPVRDAAIAELANLQRIVVQSRQAGAGR